MTARGPLITAILAVRNGERYLAEALRSVFAQGYEPLEVLLVDGRSTDRTVSVARGFPGVRVVTQEGRGVADAYNMGVREARGELLAFLSHDDRWLPGKLAAQEAALEADPTLGYVVGRVRFELEEGGVPPRGFRPELLATEPVGRIMETLLVRREVLAEVGPFDVTLSTGEDVDFFARALHRGVRSAVVPQVVLAKRARADSLSLGSPENDANLIEVVRRALARKRERAGGGGA